MEYDLALREIILQHVNERYQSPNERFAEDREQVMVRAELRRRAATRRVERDVGRIRIAGDRRRVLLATEVDVEWLRLI